MRPWFSIIKRTLSTEKRRDIGRVFIDDRVQKILKEVTRYDDRIFATKQVPNLKTPKLVFMTDDQLERSKKEAHERVKARAQMPPVMEPDLSQPEVISRDEEIVGYTKFKIMFVDITPGYTDRNRLMSVREKDGTLRYPTHLERSRLNHIFYPSEEKSIDEPKMFEEQNLLSLLHRKEYIYILNRACVQYEPDDPRYVEITSRVYNYIDEYSDYDKLRSSRHFGPMSLYLVYNDKADNLIADTLNRGFSEDAKKLTELRDICVELEFGASKSKN